MKRLYYLLFYKLYCFGKSINEEGWEHWKALVAITVLQVILIIELLVWWTIITKIGLTIPKYSFAIPLGLAITIINYYALLHHDRWKKYAEEFKKHSKRKSIIISWLVFLFVLLILSSLIFSFYKMSQVDWKKYR